ncbi:MAG: hypothetical protein EYC70_02305 [Planctomycetota bacterium]|nr:MAG: hypothetical protein EYC70_02305 [Planctomycetota bacterium]
MRNLLRFRFLCAALAAAAPVTLLAAHAGQEGAAPVQADAPQYVGADKCKPCHNKAEAGAMHDKWAASLHAKAMESLASEAAKKLAAEKGIADPLKAPECLKCHQTAHGVDAKLVAKSFKPEQGVQCESCHGPGSLHVKARMTAAAKGEGKGQPGPLAIPAGEQKLADEALCKSCHNPESPSYKEFVFKDFLPKIRHLHPNRKEPRVKLPGEPAAGAN